MLKSIKEELKKRKEEELELKKTVENEKKRLEEQRLNTKKNIIRKIKFVDNIKIKQEEKEDAKSLNQFRLNEEDKLKAARGQRLDDLIKNNKKAIVMAVCVCILLIAGGRTIAIQVNEANIKQAYVSAVDYIAEEKYENGLQELNGIDEYKDAVILKEFCNVMINLERYKGKPKEVQKKLPEISEIEDKRIKEIVKYARKQCLLVGKVQKALNKLDEQGMKKAVLDIEASGKLIKDIESRFDTIEPRYMVMVDKHSYKQLSNILTNVEKETDLGKTIVAINEIGEVKLSKAKSIKNARKIYDSLSDADKKKVLNYEVLTKAEDKLEVLIEDKEETEREEQEKAERKATEEARNDVTVYLTASGNCYHFQGCRCLRNTNMPIKRNEAEARGYRPCGICN